MEDFNGMALVVTQLDGSKSSSNPKLLNPQFHDFYPEFCCQQHLSDGKILAPSQ
jgi:hypothetical protein